MQCCDGQIFTLYILLLFGRSLTAIPVKINVIYFAATRCLRRVMCIHTGSLETSVSYFYYAPATRVGALSDDARLTSVCRVHRA